MASDETPKKESLPNLSQLMAEEKLDKDRQNEILDGRKKKNKRNRLAIIIPMATVSVLLIGGIAIYDPIAQNFRWANGDSSTGAERSDGTTAGSAEGTNTTKAPIGTQDWWETETKVFPVEVPAWSTDEAVTNAVDQGGASSEETESEGEAGTETDGSESLDRFARGDDLQKLYNSVGETYKGKAISNMAIQLPSIEGGYTDDSTKAINEDGSLNGSFSFWTREGFVGEMGVMINRLLNPTFGGWQGASEGGADEAAKTKLADLFTTDWLNANGPEALPIVTTANSPLAVEYLPSGGTRWVGTVNPDSEVMEFTYDRALKGYIVDYSADVTYSSWQSDQNVASFTGKLTLKLMPNSIGANTNSGNRVVISEAGLTLG